MHRNRELKAIGTPCGLDKEAVQRPINFVAPLAHELHAVVTPVPGALLLESRAVQHGPAGRVKDEADRRCGYRTWFVSAMRRKRGWGKGSIPEEDRHRKGHHDGRGGLRDFLETECA